MKTSQIDGLTREKKTPSMQKLERLPEKKIVNFSKQSDKRSEEREKNLRTIYETCWLIFAFTSAITFRKLKILKTLYIVETDRMSKDSAFFWKLHNEPLIK
jgi:hypothetical protein